MKSIPLYRSKVNLAPVSVGAKKANPNAVIALRRKTQEEQIQLSQQRICWLQRTLEQYALQGNGFPEVVDFLMDAIATEKSWSKQLEDNAQAKPLAKPEYKGLVPFDVQAINQVAATKKGVFYIKYRTARVRGCSFVSKSKLKTALTQIRGRVDEIWAAADRLGVEVDGFSSELAVADLTDKLVEWNNELPSIAAPLSQPSPPSSLIQHKVKRQIFLELTNRRFSVTPSEEDGDVFLRVYRDSDFYGVFMIDAAGEIYLQSAKDEAPLQQVHSIASAVEKLIATFQPPTISAADWEELKAIAKLGKLSTPDTLGVVLDPKYLRTLAPGENPSPRMVLSKHFQEIKQQLKIRAVFPLETDRAEYKRIEAIYPRQAAGLRELCETVFKAGFSLKQLTTQPFSVLVVSGSRILGKAVISASLGNWLVQPEGDTEVEEL